MKNFIYQNPTKIVFGRGQIAELENLLPKDKNILMTCGGGSIKKNGVYDQVRTALQGHSVEEFWGIEPNPTYETLSKALGVISDNKIEYLLAVGGGSVLDGTKFLAGAACFESGDPWDILAKQAPIKKALPLGTVLTLPATGSESNPYAVISRKSTDEKLCFASPLVYPKFCVLDPQTTFSLPERQLINGIADAYVHTLEQYLTYPCGGTLQDRQAEGVLQTLIEMAPTIKEGSTDYDTRATFMWVATQALNGLIACGVAEDWATHMIGHELTAFYGLDHAQSLVVVGPRVLKHQIDKKREKLVQYGERVWGCDNAEAAIEQTEDFYRNSLGMKTRLSECGVSASEAAEKISARFKERGFNLGEYQDITPEGVGEILRSA